MNCPQCNLPIADNSKFCMNCGAKISPQQIEQQQISPPNSLVGTGVGELTPSYNTYQAGAERNWLERLTAKIPGYKGYLEKETRRDVDKIHREHVATMLFQLKSPI